MDAVVVFIYHQPDTFIQIGAGHTVLWIQKDKIDSPDGIHSRRNWCVWWAILPSKIASGEVGVWLPWWYLALSFQLQVTEVIF